MSANSSPRVLAVCAHVSLYSDMVERGSGSVTIWKTTEPGDMNTFGVTDRYLEFNYRGPDWDQNSILI